MGGAGTDKSDKNRLTAIRKSSDLRYCANLLCASCVATSLAAFARCRCCCLYALLAAFCSRVNEGECATWCEDEVCFWDEPEECDGA